MADNELMQKALADINRLMAGYLGRVRQPTYYVMGRVGRKSVCYTRSKTEYKRKKGFWSWIQTDYKKRIKRTRFAKSGSRKKAEARAVRLLEQLREKIGES